VVVPAIMAEVEEVEVVVAHRELLWVMEVLKLMRQFQTS
jgi:hypothetical protein